MLECWSNASTPNLWDQGISVRLTSHTHPVRQRDHTRSYATAVVALGLKVCWPIEPKLGVYMRMTGGELTQPRWMH
jgi:hypothetical protein